MKHVLYRHILVGCLFCCVAGLFSCNCKSNSEMETAATTTIVKDTLLQYNIIILLDLSDRVLAENQGQRDLGIIKHIYESFKGIAGEPSKMFFNSKDKIRVKILEQQKVPYQGKISAWEDTLDMDMSKIPFEQHSAPQRKKRDDAFYRTINDVYSNCILKSKDDYLGANIQKYFKQDLILDLDKASKNKIFILTDGYPVVDGKTVWVDELENLSGKFSSFKENTDVYFLELKPRDDQKDEEYPKLIAAWSTWLEHAGFKAEDENYFQKNGTNSNSVEARINTTLGLVKSSIGIVDDDAPPKQTCEAKLVALINQEVEIDGKNIDDLIANAFINCHVNEIKIDDGHNERSLKNFLLVNLASKAKSKYRITETKLDKGVFLCKTSKI